MVRICFCTSTELNCCLICIQLHKVHFSFFFNYSLFDPCHPPSIFFLCILFLVWESNVSIDNYGQMKLYYHYLMKFYFISALTATDQPHQFPTNLIKCLAVMLVSSSCLSCGLLFFSGGGFTLGTCARILNRLLGHTSSCLKTKGKQLAVT